MRENQERKNLPMANPEESKSEAPGLRVGSNAWKWPPVWPYDSNFFKRKVELEASANGSKSKENAAAGMKGILTGAAAVGGGLNTNANNNSSSERGNEGENNSAREGDASLFDSLKYWNEKKDVFTELDARVAEKITKLSYIMYL